MKKTFNISEDMVNYLESYSSKQGVTQSSLIETALQVYMVVKAGITKDIKIRKNTAYISAGVPKGQRSIDEF